MGGLEAKGGRGGGGAAVEGMAGEGVEEASGPEAGERGGRDIQSEGEEREDAGERTAAARRKEVGGGHA